MIFIYTTRRKRCSIIMENCGKTEYNYDKRLHIRGGFEIIIESCNFYLDENGQKCELDEFMKQQLRKIKENL